MHIIALEKEPHSYHGGKQRSQIDICRSLSQRGHKISLLYVEEGDILKKYEEFCAQIVKINRFEIEQSQKITSTFNLLADIWKISTSKNSVVYTNQFYDNLFGSALARLKNIPLVCHLRHSVPKTFGLQWDIGLKGVTRFIAVSNQTKLDWVESGFIKPEKIDVVYNGINTEIFKPSEDFPATRQKWNIPEDTKVILYVGRLNQEKGLEILIKAYAALAKNSTRTRLLIAGSPVGYSRPEAGEKYKTSLKLLATNLGIEKYVDFLGHRNDTVSLYQVSDVTVLPSLYSEPFGRTIIESMACGTPAVGSRTGGITEILTGEFQKCLFEPENDRDLSDILNNIINWRGREYELSERCRNHILDKFTLEKMVEGVEKILLSIVNN